VFCGNRVLHQKDKRMTKLIVVFLFFTIFHSQERSMDTSLQLYTHGLWIVKTGNEKAFIDHWSSFAQWTAKNYPGGGKGYLLQDLDNPQQFVSFGPWKDMETVNKWREDPEFKKFVSKARELCESFQPRSLKVVASSTN